MVHPIIAQAIEFERHAADVDGVAWEAEFEAQIAAGTPKIFVTTAAPGNGWDLRVVAYVGVELQDGGQAAASEPQLLKMRRRAGMTTDKTATWWAQKNFGKELPISIKHQV